MHESTTLEFYDHSLNLVLNNLLSEEELREFFEREYLLASQRLEFQFLIRAIQQDREEWHQSQLMFQFYKRYHRVFPADLDIQLATDPIYVTTIAT